MPDDEEARFVRMLATITKGIEQPAQITGRPRLPIGDVVFGCVYAVYLKQSSRATARKLTALYEAGLIGSLFHFNAISNYMRDPALTTVLDKLSIDIGKLLPESSEETWEFIDERLEGMGYRYKSESAFENTSLCSVVAVDILELLLCSER